MKEFLLIALFTWIASVCGQTIMRLMQTVIPRPLDRFAYSCALGLGIAAYGILVLGLCGLLSPAPIATWWLLMAAISHRTVREQLRNMGIYLRSFHGDRRRFFTQNSTRGGLYTSIIYCCTVIMGGCLLIAIVASFQPPGALEWDVLSYHLAAPKIYLQQHRISILPTQHQTNFPFTVEMLYTAGLAFGTAAAANLIHLLCAILTSCGIIAFGERCRTGAGYLGALIFVTTPLVLWEASVAYIDIGVALYVTLGSFAVLNAIRLQRARSENMLSTAEGPDAWLRIAAWMLGFALGTKYLTLIPVATLTFLLVWRKMPVKKVAAFICIVAIIGSPWYIKNAVLMQNPVYPFAYRLFPHTRYWSLDREAPYRHEQNGFGYPHSFTDPRSSLVNLLATPWTVVADANRYFNPGEFTFSALIGGLYAAFCLALIVSPRRPGELSDLLFVAGIQLVMWFFVAQVARYVIPVLPLLAVASGVSAAQMLNPPRKATSIGQRTLQLVTVVLLLGQTGILFGSVTLLPRAGKEAREIMQRTGLNPTALSIADAINQALRPDAGKLELSQHLDNYDAVQWINANTTPHDGVILYEDTRGFYLDRPYLWGNDQHSSYIPYRTFQNGAELTSWMNQHGFRYAVIDLNWSPDNINHASIAPEQAPELIDRWYVHPMSAPAQGSWRRTVGDAVRKGLWTIVYVSHGTVVLRIGEPEGQSVGGLFPSCGWRRG